MNKYLYAASLLLVGVIAGAMIGPNKGYRVPEMKIHLSPTSDVMVWKTVIPASEKNAEGLAAHRHLYARILIPLTEGTLTRRDVDGKTTDYPLTIGKPIFLDKDTTEGMHTDENYGKEPIETMVVQFNQSSSVTFDALTEEEVTKTFAK